MAMAKMLTLTLTLTLTPKRGPKRTILDGVSGEARAGRVAALLCPDEEIETLVAPNGDLVFARALHARHAPALGDVLEGASVVEVQATSGDLELPAVRLVVAGD